MEVSGRFLSINSKDERGLVELNKHTRVRVMIVGKEFSCLKSRFIARNLMRDQVSGGETDLIDQIAFENLWHDDLTRAEECGRLLSESLCGRYSIPDDSFNIDQSNCIVCTI